MPGRNPRRGWDEGSTAVEAALTIGVLTFLIFGIVEFGMALWNWNTMSLAVQNAGRYAMVQYSGGNSCDTSCALSQVENNLKTVPAAVSTSCGTPSADEICLSAATSSGSPSTMTLTAKYGFSVIGLSPTFTLTSEATFPLE